MPTQSTLRPWLCLTLGAAACYSPTGDLTGSGPKDENETSSAATSTTDADATTGSSETGGSPGASSGIEDESTTSIADESTGDPPAPFCGDGEVGAEEACDDGDANALTGACRPDCTAASCGDGDIWAGVEGCDDGPTGNVLEVGACAPDCSRVIEQRAVTRGEAVLSGDFGPNPVAYADAQCPPGTLALFAHTGVREAALDAFDTSGSIDWVLQPFTAYVNWADELIWITDEVPLLGVRTGEQQQLEAAIFQCEGLCPPASDAVTGLASGWVTRVDDTCDQWSSDDTAGSLGTGKMAATDSRFLYGGGTEPCDAPYNVRPYCIEQ